MLSSFALVLIVAFVVELVVLVQVAGAIGALTTALLVVFASVCGIGFLKARGGGLVRATMTRFSEKGSLDTTDLADRTLTIVAGLLLVIPGFVTAGLGLILLLPPVRALARPVLLARLASTPGLNLRFGTSVVDVDSVVVTDADDGDITDPPTSARPELG